MTAGIPAIDPEVGLLRFAVHRPGSPDASPRSHGMSCRDVFGRVQVRVAGKTARPAAEDGLALARPPVNRSARAAALRRECWVYSLDATGSLILKPALEEPPAGGKDLPVQAGLASRSSPRLPEGALDRTSHVADVQILDTDQVKPPGEVSAELLAPVSARVDLTSLELRDSNPDPGAASRSTLASRKLVLEQPKPSLAARTQSRNSQQFTGGKRCARGDTSIQGHDFTRPRARDCARDDGERYVPASGAVERNPVGLHPSRHRPRPSKPDPARLGDPDFPSAPIQSADMSRSNCDDPEALAAPGLSPPRPSMSTPEEMLHGLGKVPQRLLLDHLASVAQPSMLRASRGQLPALPYISRRAPASGTPPRLLFDGQVPDESRLGAMVFEDHLLSGCGTQPVAAHTNTISRASDVSGKLGRPSLKGPCAPLRSA
jgi:hypothetical protein